MSLSTVSWTEQVGGYDVSCSQFNKSFISTPTTTARATEEIMSSSSTSKLVRSSSYSYSNSISLQPLTCIEEEKESISDPMFDGDDEESLFSIDFNFDHNNKNYKEEAIEDEDDHDREVSSSYYYYVAVGRNSKSSMDALLWTLNHSVIHDDHDQSSSSTTVVIMHVFPPLQFIPSPLGMLPKSRVTPTRVDEYMALERDKRMKLLQKYVDACSSARVKVNVMLIESDTVAKAILDLIPAHNITQLVLGTTKSSMRKLRSKKGSGIASQILRNAPETCDVKIVCKGKEVIVDMITRSTSSRSSYASSMYTQDEDDHEELPISPDDKQVSRPAPATTSGALLSLNGYKAIWRGNLKFMRQLGQWDVLV